MLITAENGPSLLSISGKTGNSPLGMMTSLKTTSSPAATVANVTLLNDLVTFVPYGIPVNPAPVSPSQTEPIGVAAAVCQCCETRVCLDTCCLCQHICPPSGIKAQI
ncbi:hypothetical protein PoB_004869400 [Plakobranchus ocellatus]|uniref:Uncharacterized protein n=1 Tax=Plakobranchus ocellatus TaxID=259542 RepID=A0AAV4BPZ7_9GAST|nr:hypothetical protein PoB_004869400 [Plakobranchus ocellatus]